MKAVFILTITLFFSFPVFSREYFFKMDRFNFPAPKLESLYGPISLWATNYFLPEVKNGRTRTKGLIAFRDIDGNKLGPVVTHEEWCRSAMEGSVRVVFKKGRARTYNYFADSDMNNVDCSRFYQINVSKSKFKLARGPFGDGVNNFQLNPFRTIATDPNVIPIGTVVFIPEARGVKIIFPNGERIVHDGYFFAGDIGGAIKENHIDVFSGISKKIDYFSWATSSENGMFDAFIITDQNIIDKLTQQHL